MATYNTGNALGSTDPRDLLDNSQIADHYVSDTESTTWQDRFGNARKTWKGIETDAANQLAVEENSFQQFLLNSGYEIMADYTDGPITFERRNQVTAYNSQFYRPKASVTLPYTTTGNTATTWATDESNFVSVGDAVLRQEINSVITPIYGMLGGQDNGIADSLLAQEAFKGGNKTVVFPRGTYFMRIPLHVESGTRVIIPPGCILMNDIRLTDAPKYFALDAKGNAECIFINAIHGDPTYSYGYTGDSNIIIEGGGKIDGYWRQQREEYCSSIKIAHGENILIRDLVLDNQWKSHFIEINSSRHARITGCRFGYIEKSGATGNWECINIDYSTTENYPHAGGWDNTPCHDITIDNNTSHANEALVGSHTMDANNPHTNMMIFANRGYTGVKSSDSTAFNNGGVVKGYNWKKVQIFSNNWQVATIAFDYIRLQNCDDVDIHDNQCISIDLTTYANQTGIYVNTCDNVNIHDNDIKGPFGYSYLTKISTKVRHNNNRSDYACTRAFYFESCTDVVTDGNHQGWGFSLLANGFLTEFVSCDQIRVRSLHQSILETATIKTQATASLILRECTNVLEVNYQSIDDFPYSAAAVKNTYAFAEIKIVKGSVTTTSMAVSSDTDIQCLGGNEVLYYSRSVTATTSVTLSRNILNYHSMMIFLGTNPTGPTSASLNLVQSYGNPIAADNVLFVPFKPVIDASTGALTYSGTEVSISADGLTLTLSNAAYVKAIVANKDGYSSYSS